jgi:arylsulfatase A
MDISKQLVPMKDIAGSVILTGIPIKRRTMLAMTAGWLCHEMLSYASPTTDHSERPNIVFLLADDLGWSDTAVYGGDLVNTPNLTRLAKSGVRFTNAYSAAPVCSPSRASLLTGKYPARLHMTTWYEASQAPPTNKKLIPPTTVGDLPLSETTIAEVLQSNGYLTAHIGKWHLGSAGYYPENQGFDIDIGATFWGAPSTHFYPYKGTYWDGEPRYVPHLEWGKPGEYLADRLTSEALNVMTKAKDRPFFLDLWFHSVHIPIEAPPNLVAAYKHQIRPGLHHTNATYAAMVENLDENVGRVLDHIEKLGIADKTIVVFGSDNGGYIGKSEGEKVTDNYPLRSGKGALYEGGIRVPLIVRWPGNSARNVTCNEPVITNDFYPTVLEMTGLIDKNRYEQKDGRSLAPLLRNPKLELDRKNLYFHYPHYYETTTPVSAVRNGKWKLLEYLEDGHCELYDLEKDLSEKHDLSSIYPQKVIELRNQLHLWRESVNAQMPILNPAVAETDPRNRWDAKDQELASVD